MKEMKKGLGRGLGSLIPEQTAQEELKEKKETLSDERKAGEAVAEVAMILNEKIIGMDVSRAERMLRMIIALCQSELRGA